MSATVHHDEVLEGVALERYEPPTPASLFGTTEPAEVVAKATLVADALADVIKAKRLYSNIGGRSHVLVEGWQLLGVMLGVTAVCVRTEEISEGTYKATVEARTADGRVVGKADAICSKQERTWKQRDDYARLSMAQTRATAKALKGPLGFIVSLAGYDSTPAEEMPRGGARRPAAKAAPKVNAKVPAGSEKVASAAQRRLINAKAADAKLVELELANVILIAAEKEPRSGLTAQQAKDLVKRLLDRLPQRLVDPVLEAIVSAAEDVEF